MNCDICNKEYGRGKGYKGERYKNMHFCSEECYNKFLKNSHVGDMDKLKSYISEWSGGYLNWQFLMKQIKQFSVDYNLSYHDIYMILKYCKTYEQLDWQDSYGLGQFIPKYIQPTPDSQ